MRDFPTYAASTESLEGKSSPDAYGNKAADEKASVSRHEKVDSHVYAHTLERTNTGSTMQPIAQTATGQALIGQDEDPRIDSKTFFACLAISFLWTGSQIPLYMLLVSNNFVLAEIGGASIQSWFILAPLAALAATAPVAGTVADIFGRRWTILVGGLFLIIGLVLYGTSHTVTQLIVSLPFSGVGAALLEINALAAVNEIAPNKLRGFYTSMLIWTIVPFFPLGIYALEIANHTTWRWNVWIPLVWCAIGLVMTFFYYRPPPRQFLGHELTRQQKFARIDYLGTFLSLAGVILFLFGLASGGYKAPWASALVLVPLILGVVLLLVMAGWETVARYPIFPPGMFKNTRVFVLTLIITAIAGANFFSVLILWPKYILSAFYGHSIAYQGLLIMSQTMGTLFGAGFFSWTITRFQGSIRPQMALSCILMGVGLGSIKAVHANQPWAAGLCVFIGGVGIGGIIVPASVITQLCSPDEFLGTVTALTFVARVLGGGIGYTVFYHVLNVEVTRLLNDLTRKDTLAIINIVLGVGITNTAEISAFLTKFSLNDEKGLLKYPGVTHATIDKLSVAATSIWADGFGYVWLVTVAFSGVGLICSLFLGNVTKYMTNHRAVRIFVAALSRSIVLKMIGSPVIASSCAGRIVKSLHRERRVESLCQ